MDMVRNQGRTIVRYNDMVLYFALHRGKQISTSVTKGELPELARTTGHPGTDNNLYVKVKGLGFRVRVRV